MEQPTPMGSPEEIKKEDRKMMQMPDGSLADVTGMSTEDKQDLINSYKNN